MRIPVLYTLGINSNCTDGKNIIMLDYDIKDIVIIKKDINRAITENMLSSFYLISSTNGYNAFCLDKLEFDQLKRIYKTNFTFVDKDFKEMSWKKGYFTIRIGLDKFYSFTILSSENNMYEKSLAHKRAIQNYYNVPIHDNIHFDNSEHVQICRYENTKYGTGVLI